MRKTVTSMEIKPFDMIPVYNRFDKAVEKKMLKAKRMRKFRKPYLINSPDLYEKWLEDQEATGWNLYLAEKKWNTFYFLKGNPRTVKYSVDFQINTSKLYFEQHQQAGWKLILSGYQLPTYTTYGYYVWAKEYGSDEPVPRLYETNGEANKIKRKIARTNLGWMIAMFVLWVLMFIVNLLEIINPFNDYLFNLVGNILIVSMGSFLFTLNIVLACRVFLYLSRLKKSGL